MKNRLSWFGISIVLLIGMVVPASGDRPDVILEWNAVALKANLIDHNGLDTPGNLLSDTQGPPASARVLAIVHAAMFDAYNSVKPRYTSYLVRVPWARNASADAAVAKAAHDVLMDLYSGPEEPRPQIREMVSDSLKKTLRRVRSRPRKIRGIIVGKIVAKIILQSRFGDSAFLGGDYTPTVEIGYHDVDPKNPGQSFISPDFGGLSPFGVESVTPYLAPTPPPISSSEYAMAMEEVKRLGEFRGGSTGATVPTNDESYVIANYWSYNGSPGTGTPPRLYNQIARLIAEQRRNKVGENARLFALLNIALGDAGISAWDSKYTYEYWRPVLGIRNANIDGNALTDPFFDPTWCALGGSRSNPFPGEQNFTPPFPAYTSGHATFGACVFKTLANFYQQDEISFTFVSDEWNGSTLDQFNRVRPLVPRSFDSLSYASAENAASRVFNGVHWRYDGSEGVRAGYGIANELFDTLLRPVHGNAPSSIADPDFEFQIAKILDSY